MPDTNDTRIIINPNPTENPGFTGGELVKPSPDGVIDINPLNQNSDCLGNAVNQLFWDLNQSGILQNGVSNYFIGGSITSKSYTDSILGLVSANLCLRQFFTGGKVNKDLFIRGEALSTALTGSTSQEIDLDLDNLGISPVSAVNFSNIHIESSGIVLGVSGTHQYDVCSINSELVLSSSHIILKFYVTGLDTSQTYQIKQFSVRLYGNAYNIV